ncbi:MAG: type III polyketide synthase [Crocinitomicaceae bacterium]|nr:type III polyketide synthase [Crocinitomicaceae bacterium]
MSYISAIETSLPAHCHTQKAMSDFYANSTDDLTARRKIHTVARKAAIDTRYSVLDDFSKKPEDFTFFSKNRQIEPEPSLGQRMSCFRVEALNLSMEAINKIQNIEKIKESITHVITVTCTGLFTPGLDIEIIKELNLKPTTQRSSINFMGCNAAILALNSANNICNSIPNSKVLVVCVELCTLHFQKNYSDDYILSTALFADGCAAVIVDSEPSNETMNLEIKHFDSMIIHEGFQEMAWEITEKGFIMNLTSYVSDLINGNMTKFLSSLKVEKESIDYWAIHPGGKKILDDFKNTLELNPSELHHSYDVLRQLGNMSSATILFVLKALIDGNTSAKKGEQIFSAAFGPGLSVETMRLQYV